MNKTQEKTASPESIKARRPLKVTDQDKRRFVRLEITKPMAIRRIKDAFGNYWAEGDQENHGTLLNLSAGGVLIEVEEPLNEGDVVGMRFVVPDVEPLDGVLGLVKRCELDEDVHLVGVQFVNREQLKDMLTEAEMTLLDGKFSEFQQTVREVLNNYLYREQV